MNAAAERRLSEYCDRIGRVLGRKGRRESFALYAEGIFGDGERKSIGPIAARACADPARADAEHQRLLHFALDAPWSDHDVRLEAARYALDAMTAKQPVESWIIDDTGFLKQGSHSVGVQRQYTGSAGKITNCQVGVSLTVATRTDQVPIDFALYLPGCRGGYGDAGYEAGPASSPEARTPAYDETSAHRGTCVVAIQVINDGDSCWPASKSPAGLEHRVTVADQVVPRQTTGADDGDHHSHQTVVTDRGQWSCLTSILGSVLARVEPRTA